MAFQGVRNLPISSLSGYSRDNGSSVALDAAGESCALIGRLQLPARTGSKTISAAGGGGIFWRTGTPVTWANGSSNMKVGIQDVSAATGLEDASYDVRADLVGGVATISASAFQLSAMTSGTKTIAHGDLIAIVLETSARAGADSVVVRRITSQWFASSTMAHPYGSADTGSLIVQNSAPFAAIKFDDGTIGWIQGTSLVDFAVATIAFNSGSTPDEYIATWTQTYAMQLAGIGLSLNNIASADSFEIILYSDPYGTPAIVETVTPDPDQLVSGTGVYIYPITTVQLVVGTVYGVAVRPTSVNNININYLDLGAGNEGLKLITPFPDIKMASRTNQTGAFTETATKDLPYLLLDPSGFDDAVSSGATVVVPIE